MKSAQSRDTLRADWNVICFETEAAGLMDNFPCVVVRGISDYSDDHKHDGWQPYAAVVAAAYAKDLLRVITPEQVDTMDMPVREITTRCK
jgi:nucleoside phosphorylase